MGRTEDDTTAGSRLRLLYDHFRERAVTSPEGHSYVPAGPRTTRITAPAPADLGVVDHITASLTEVAAETHAANPDAGPLPSRVEAVYDWYRQHTQQAPEAVQERREAVIYRQQLEHAITMGDVDVVRPHRCPACRTFSLLWPQDRPSPSTGRVICSNRRCLTKQGLTRTWTLARLAYEYVAAEKTFGECAT